MKFSYRWLKELSGTEKTPEELAAFLTMRAFEVEEVVPVGFSLPDIVVGTVLSVEQHPNADRLRVARVNLGEGNEKTIVCGAPNLALNQKVAVALPGASLPGDVFIKQTDIRGVVSDGMICSQKELGLGENHEGILVLPEEAEAGTGVADFLATADSVLDVKVLPDRAHDCLSHVGLSREIAALEHRKMDYDYDGLLLPKSEDMLSSFFSISLEAKGKSDRYIGALVRNVTVDVSPKWLVDRLSVFGMRSINNIVDATNLIMLELGQPLHAFDWDAIAGSEQKKIGPRLANPGETLVLLDGKSHLLDAEDIVIADSERALALGGIMGGVASGVTSKTKHVFFEAAHFDPVSIRRTRTRLGIESDASARFEKGLSPDLAERALVRLLEVVSHIAGGEVVSVSEERSAFALPKSIEFSSRAVTSLLGTDVSVKEMKSILELRGFEVSLEEKTVSATPPPYRIDVESVADIAEEIGKGIGYDRIESVAPSFLLGSPSDDPIRAHEASLRDFLSANGFTESYNYSFYSESDASRLHFEKDAHLSLANPMNPDQTLVRKSLLPGLLKNIAFNGRRFHDIRMFELGKVYERSGESVVETRLVSGVARVSSKRGGEASPFVLLMSEMAHLLDSLRVVYSVRPYQNTALSLWHPVRTADIFSARGERIGTLGEVHPAPLKGMGISGRVAAFEFDTRALLSAIPGEGIFAPIRKQPETLRDLSCFVPSRTTVAEVRDCIVSSGQGLVLDAELFDRYMSPDEGRSLAFHIRMGREDRALTGEEADVVFAGIVRAIETHIGGTLRVS
ncbi:MAG: phenylalanine--tRNA ligase subunit beta [Candidatus Moraniibacteriota bacterium]|nr:MAG: phenylalanine--tRNA ligase subunit beta [Candidatus Moranbacteria bacterium]